MFLQSCHLSETGTLSQLALNLALNLARPCSITSHLPAGVCHPLGWDMALGAEPRLSLGRGHPRGQAQPAAVGKQLKEEFRSRCHPPWSALTHPAAPLWAQGSALTKSMFRARAVMGQGPQRGTDLLSPKSSPISHQRQHPAFLQAGTELCSPPAAGPEPLAPSETPAGAGGAGLSLSTHSGHGSETAW